jgi:hypothetical protein
MLNYFTIISNTACNFLPTEIGHDINDIDDNEVGGDGDSDDKDDDDDDSMQVNCILTLDAVNNTVTT